MRHQLVPALLLVTVLLGFAVGGAVVVAAGATPTDGGTPTPTAKPDTVERSTVSGTVTYPNGTPATDAYVLVGSEAMFMKLSPDELLAIARDDPQDTTVLRPDDDGRFSVETDAQAVVAVSPFGISAVHEAEGDVALTLQPARPLRFHVSAGSVKPGNTTTVYLDLPNTGDAAVENLQLHVDLPPGWSVVSAETNGVFHADNATFTWSSVLPGEWADARLTVLVPEDAPVVLHEVSLSAESATNPVSAPTATVEVNPVKTPKPSPTSTSLPGGDEDHAGSNGTDTPDASTAQSVPGFGLVAAMLALLAALQWTRRD